MKLKVFALMSMLMLCLSLNSYAQTTITEGFEYGMPTTAPTTETNVTLSSGVWAIYKANQGTTKYTGNYGVTLANQTTAPGYVITPSISTVGTITFWARAGGSGKTITVQKSVNGGEFTTIYTPTLTSTFAQYSYAVNDTAKNIRIKIMNTPNSGTTEYIDDVTITTLSKSFITLSTTSISDFGVREVGTNSASKSYIVSGSVLEAPLQITASTGFDVSTDDINFHNSVSLIPSQTDSSVSNTTIYIRFAPTNAGGRLSGSITHTSGSAISKIVTVSGTAIANEPTIQSLITFGEITGNSIVVNFSGGNGARKILVTMPNSEVSWTPTDGITPIGVNANYSLATDQNSGNKIVYVGNGTTVIVTGLTSFTTYYFAVYELNGIAPNSENYLIALPGTSSATTLKVPELKASISTLSFGSIINGNVSEEKSYALTGMYLNPAESHITVRAPEGFEISKTRESGFTAILTIPYSQETINSTIIYVRFTPTERKKYSGVVNNIGGNASAVNVNVSGSGIDSSDLNTQALYVSPTGDDINGNGTITNPFYSLQKAVDLVKAGGKIYLRGGVYQYSTRINIKKYGLENAYILISSYPGERAILDFSSMADADANQGIRLTGSYIHIFGIDIKGAGDNGLLIERDKPAGGKYNSIKDSVHQGHHNIIEQCNFYENRDSGLQIKNLGAHNKIINCDSYYNRDASDGDADGFAPKLTVGTDNYFYGCRAWQNSDDGWDMYLKAAEDGFPQDMVTTMENCWTFMNGYYKNGSPSKGNGNGFKLGGSANKDQRHDVVLKRCLAFDNLQKGFDQNGNAGNMTLFNCTGFAFAYIANSSHFTYRIDINTNPLAPGRRFIHTNCVSIGDGLPRKTSLYAECEMIGGTGTTNDYLTASTDFITIDTTGIRGPRKPDGGLPDVNFMRIKTDNTKLIDKGTIVNGIVYIGSAPDLGAFEFGMSMPTNPPDITSINKEPSTIINTFVTLKNYPNPFNPTTQISYNLSVTSPITLKIYNVLGQEISTLVQGVRSAGQHTITWNALNSPSGVYFAVLEFAGNKITQKMLLTK